MTVGMLDHAERIYRSVAETDPRNSIAVVGLARVALERGQDVEALELARRALRIDAENVAARRLVARLEEVLTMRGVPLPPEEPGQVVAAAPISKQQPDAAPAAATAHPSTPALASPARRGLISRLLRRG